MNAINAPYSQRLFSLPPEFVSAISRIESHKTVGALAGAWFEILCLCLLGAWMLDHTYAWLLLPVLELLIAGRQGVLLQITHEGAHHLISTNTRMNRFYGDWLAALPVGLTLEDYTRGHAQHHANTNTADDLPTDREKYLTVDLKSGRLFRLFVNDLFGVTALRSFLGHTTRTQATPIRLKLLKLCIAQFVVLLVIFQAKVFHYAIFWLLPLFTLNMVLLRVRGIAEHGSPFQHGFEVDRADQGNRYTRSVLTPFRPPASKLGRAIEKLLIGSLSANFHHEHHLLPKVPFYNLEKLHKEIASQVAAMTPEVYETSYLAAFLRGKLSA